MGRRGWIILLAVVILVVSGASVHESLYISFGSGLTEEQKESMVSKPEFRNQEITLNNSSNGPEVTLRMDGPNDALDIDFRELEVVWADATGVYTLTPADDFDDSSDISGTEYSHTVFSDSNGSAPVMDGIEDQFGIVVRPRTFTNESQITGDPASICVHEPRLENFSVTFRLVTESGDTNDSGVYTAKRTNFQFNRNCRNVSTPS